MSYLCPKCGDKLTIGSRTVAGKPRWYCRGTTGARKHCYSTTNPEGNAVETRSGNAPKRPRFKRSLKGKNRFIVTTAQNATPAHEGFLKSLESACNHLNAELLVIPIRYKNPTSRWTKSQRNAEIWDDKLTPYLYNARRFLNRNLVMLGDIKTQPTATSPLTGFEAITHGESAILAHTKLQLKTVATPQHRQAKILTTTGACTVPNYTDSKAGALGRFHHTLGACMVEIDGGRFYLRQINASKDAGNFTDLATLYGGRPWDAGCTPAEPALALIMGDAHVDYADPAVVAATLEMIELLRPQYLIWHDLTDGYVVNHHHYGNPFNAIAKLRGNRADARAEVERAFAFIERMTVLGTTSIIVPSNHDDFLTRWVMATDWKQAPGNAKFYLETALAMVNGTKLGTGGTEFPTPFIYWGRKHFEGNNRVRFLDRDESFTVAGIELGMHGDRGPNGSRGSIRNLRRMGVKSVIGHTHSPGIDEGCMQVGTMTRLKLEYTSGPSGWLNTNAVIYANGKRSLLNIINGKWRLA